MQIYTYKINQVMERMQKNQEHIPIQTPYDKTHVYMNMID